MVKVEMEREVGDQLESGDEHFRDKIQRRKSLRWEEN